MGNLSLSAPAIRFLTGCIMAVLLSSCSTPRTSRGFQGAVGKVDLRAAPRMEALAQQIRDTGNRIYPQICALLTDGNWQFPERFDIGFKTGLKNGRMAEARMNKIWLNADYADQLRQEPALLENVLVHEMAHVAQHYYRPIIGRWLIYDPCPPVYWVEGIADYVCFKLCETNSARCAECGSAFAHYRDGYSCAGAFLLFIERNSSPGIVAQLNTELRQGSYSDAFFWEITGKKLAELWGEFKQTPAFTANASRMTDLQQELGFNDGKPPKDFEERLTRFLDRHADTRTKRLLAGARIPGLKKQDSQSRLALAYYFTQPGGTAEAFMVDLQENHRLPGFAKGDHGTLTGFLNHRILDVVFPVERTFTAAKPGDASTYHYTVIRQQAESGWTLQRAWRTNPGGGLAEEYPVSENRPGP